MVDDVEGLDLLRVEAKASSCQYKRVSVLFTGGETTRDSQKENADGLCCFFLATLIRSKGLSFSFYLLFAPECVSCFARQGGDPMAAGTVSVPASSQSPPRLRLQVGRE